MARTAQGPFARRGRSGRQADPGPEPVVPVLTRLIEGAALREISAETGFAEALAHAGAGGGRLALSVMPVPSPEAIAELASAWKLHPLLVEDLLHAGQRPKLERYGQVLFLVVRSARYLDEREEVEFSEFHFVMRPGALVIICQDGRLVDGTDARAAADGGFDAVAATLDDSAPLLVERGLLKLGAEAVVYRLLDAIIDGYFPVLEGLQTDREQVERQVFGGEGSAAERIYRLTREVIDLLHAATALARVVEHLAEGADKYRIPDELRAYLQDVADHLTRVIAETSELRDALAQILNVNATLVAQRQNEDMKKISGWAAILFAPTLIAAVYGMNFDRMPELHWGFGYPIAVGGMLAFAATLYVIFKRKKWM